MTFVTQGPHLFFARLIYTCAYRAEKGTVHKGEEPFAPGEVVVFSKFMGFSAVIKKHINAHTIF